jgi:putative transposase
MYYKPRGESELNLQVMRLMDEHYHRHPSYGVLQMQDYLWECGYRCSVKKVRRLLRKMGIMAIYPLRYLTKLGRAEYIRPYLLRNLSIERVNQVWQIDITYIPMRKGFMYLTAIIDVYSRYVVGWGISNTLDAKASHGVMMAAIQAHGKPDIINSDQGSQFTCKEWLKTLTEMEVKISMDGKGRAIDNIYIERLWRTVKQDYVYLNPAEDGWELQKGLAAFFNRYNYEKKHQGIGRIKPAEIYYSSAA